MKILILGNINSTFVLNYVKELKAKMNCEIDIFTEPIYQKEYAKQFIKYFDNIYEISKNNNGLINRIPKIRGFFRLRNLAIQINALGNYDICHIHFLSTNYGYLAPQITNKCKKLVISIWGSDFYRTKWWEKKIQYRIIKYANRITFANEQTLEEFNKYFKEVDNSKLEVIKFGLVPLNVLKNNEYITKEECKKYFDIPNNNLVITCAYHGKPIHQHIDIIRSIQKVKQKLPSDVFFLFPFTYGLNNDYYTKVKKYLIDAGLPFKILTNFLSDYEVAKLRRASDIMINVPKSDQLSGSMQESLYAENIVITGNWLPYKIFKEKGIFMLKISSVDKVGEKLIYAIKNLRSLKEKCKENSQIIWDISSWDKNIRDWINMYLEMLHD